MMLADETRPNTPARSREKNRESAMEGAGRKLRLRLLTIAVEEAFFKAVRRGMEDAAKAMQVEAALDGTPGVSAHAVIALARKALGEGVDGLALNVSESGAFASVIAEAKAQGVPCVAFNIDADKGASGNLSYIAQAGQALGRRVVSRIPRGVKALVTVHDDGVSALDERVAGVREALEAHGAEVVRLCVGQNPERGAKLILEALAERPVSAIVGTGQADTEAAGLAASRLASNAPYVAGFDLSAGIVDLMAEGHIDAAIDQQPYVQGFYPVVQLTLFLRFGLLPASMDAGAAFIDRSNLESIRRLSLDHIR
jgi:simple sugar transport system substrate-binding protein